MSYTFERERELWRSVPVDDVGYINSAELLVLPDHALIELIVKAEHTRYEGWRNHRNRWRESLGLDTTTGRHIIDFGCGIGLEALQFARRDNYITLVDTNVSSVLLARRVLRLDGFEANTAVAHSSPSYFRPTDWCDIFYMNGVLHHIPYDVELLNWVWNFLNPGGEVRLMLYSDVGWRVATGTPPPGGRAVDHPLGQRFVDFFDGQCTYSDFYSRERLEQRFGHAYEIAAFEYITPDERYCTATLVPR